VNGKNNVFRYKLEGFDEKWINIESQREAVFTNVPPGSYTFIVNVGNANGRWSESTASIKIHIYQPLWKTPVAYICYLIIAGIGIWLIRKAVLNRIYIRHKMEMDQMKIRFFTNISHEFRTPLTLILGPLNDLIAKGKDKDPEAFKLFTLMQRNGNQLLKLVNQLMEIYQLDAGFAKLKVSEENLKGFIYNIFEGFNYKAEQKKIHYHLYAEISEEEKGYIDLDKVEKILNNLISNAIKFTPVNGAVMVFANIVDGPKNNGMMSSPHLLQKNSQRFLEIKVEDSGFGIPAEVQSKIFTRFFQLEKYEIDDPGTGIGLSLVSQLTEIHRGEISVESEIMDGCRFILRIPISRQSYHRSELAKHPAITAYENNHELLLSADLLDSTYLNYKADKPILLIIDDNEDVRKYIGYNLKEDFKIIEATCGTDGLKLATELIPDLILSDVMMPGMNGIALCKALKNEALTCHIPVTLLTAKASEDYHLDGLVEGADDYITKPFNPEILKIKLKNKVKQQALYKKKFEAGMPLPKDVLINKKDKDLLSEIHQIMESNLANSEFGPDQLAKDLGMSRSVLYRKIDGLTGTSVSLMIRKYRIDHAAKLLNSQLIPIKELAFKVGFKDPSYFTSCFKKIHHVSPKEYNSKKVSVSS